MEPSEHHHTLETHGEGLQKAMAILRSDRLDLHRRIGPLPGEDLCRLRHTGVHWMDKSETRLPKKFLYCKNKCSSGEGTKPAEGHRQSRRIVDWASSSRSYCVEPTMLLI